LEALVQKDLVTEPQVVTRDEMNLLTDGQSSANNVGISILQVLAVTLPACMIGIFFAALYSSRRGKELADDPQYQERLADPDIKEYMFGETMTTLEKELPKSAKLSVLLFSFALILIALFAMFPSLLPAFGEPAKTIKMSLVIQIVMLFIGGLILLICRVKPTDVVQGKVFQAGMVAVVAIYGIAWLSDTYFEGDNQRYGAGGSLGFRLCSVRRISPDQHPGRHSARSHAPRLFPWYSRASSCRNFTFGIRLFLYSQLPE